MLNWIEEMRIHDSRPFSSGRTRVHRVKTKTKIGYEIPLTRHFYTYTPPRPLHEIDAEIKRLEAEIQALLGQVTK